MTLPNKNIFKIGHKIRTYRKTNNLTQEQLADLINCNFKTIGNIENNRTMPDLKQVINICDVLNVTLDELFSDVLLKTKNTIEPAENTEGYPKLVNRKVTSIADSHLSLIENITQKLRMVSKRDLAIIEMVVNNLANK